MLTIGPILRRSAGSTGSSRYRPSPQTVALDLKALEGRRSRTPAALEAATKGGYAAPLGLALSTLRRRLAAIAIRHATQGLETPTDDPLVRRMLRGYARTRGTAKKKKDCSSTASRRS